GKKVLLPIGKARFDNDDRRVYVNGLTKEQVENLPEYSGEAVDYDYEERVRGVYRENTAAQSAPVEGAATTYNRDTYSYDYDADLYNKPEEEAHNQPIRLYEERLVADKDRFKAGSVTVGKRVEAETAQVSVPVEKERVVIERTEPTGTSAATADHAFEDGEVARVDVYEEKANIRKEAVVREEVNVRKESTEEVVSDQVTVRREELDVDNADHAEVVTK
ncbi:MAG: YsnF/AvaK domain-containing protein, partial [Cyanobacteria bacterium J06631_9]